MHLHLAHSPDADDAFMHYAIATEQVDLRGHTFTHVMRDIESLNQAARQGEYEVSALSIHAYAHVAHRYALLPSGASCGGATHGPCVVSARPMTLADLKGRRVASPGPWTSAWLALQLAVEGVEPLHMDFARIEDAVKAGEADAGLIIHEGQLTFAQNDLFLVANLGALWHHRTGGLPLPLGGNAIRRDLGEAVVRDVARVYEEGIRHALDHREDALTHALQYARGLDREDAGTFVGMYVDQRTVKWDEPGLVSVKRFLSEARERGLVPNSEVDFAGLC